MKAEGIVVENVLSMVQALPEFNVQCPTLEKRGRKGEKEGGREGGHSRKRLIRKPLWHESGNECMRLISENWTMEVIDRKVCWALVVETGERLQGV